MTKEMTLKEFVGEITKSFPTIKGLGIARSLVERLIQLEAIENWLNVMYGVELDIKVKTAKRKEGRFYPKEVADLIEK